MQHCLLGAPLLCLFNNGLLFIHLSYILGGHDVHDFQKNLKSGLGLSEELGSLCMVECELAQLH